VTTVGGDNWRGRTTGRGGQLKGGDNRRGVTTGGGDNWRGVITGRG